MHKKYWRDKQCDDIHKLNVMCQRIIHLCCRMQVKIEILQKGSCLIIRNVVVFLCEEC